MVPVAYTVLSRNESNEHLSYLYFVNFFCFLHNCYFPSKF